MSRTLYVVEQNSLRACNFEPFAGDVLAFCFDGRYECAAAQNSGECTCARGYGGPCCDMPLGAGAVVQLSSFLSIISPFALPLLAGIAIVTLGLRARRNAARAAAEPMRALREPLFADGASALHRALNESADTCGGQRYAAPDEPARASPGAVPGALGRPATPDVLQRVVSLPDVFDLSSGAPWGDEGEGGADVDARAS